MTEEEYAAFVRRERLLARLHLENRLVALRRRLWPRPEGAVIWEDPIDREDRRLREEIHLKARAYYGAAIGAPW